MSLQYSLYEIYHSNHHSICYAYIYIYIYIYICIITITIIIIITHLRPRLCLPRFGWHYPSNATLSDMAPCAFYGSTCLIWLLLFAVRFDTFAENMCYTSSVRQVITPEWSHALLHGRRRRAHVNMRRKSK